MQGENGASERVVEDLEWIQTATGKTFHVFNPKSAEVCITDIAHALANTCRFAGHSLTFYSVAQHCTQMVSMLRDEGADTETLRAALLHDADEAYLPDVPRPIKPYLRVGCGIEVVPWRDFAARITDVVAERFGLPHGFADLPQVKRADLRMLATERRDLMKPSGVEWQALKGVLPYNETIEPVAPRMARQLFLQHFATLFKAEKL